MPPPLIQHFANLGFSTDLIYSFVIIVCSLMIYLGTKELEELTSYKGIKYFRLSFLFFAIAYFLRSVIKLFFVLFNTQEIFALPPGGFGFGGSGVFSLPTLLVFMYFSSMAVFYLLFSVMWKKWNKKPRRIYLFHILAIAIAIISILSRNPFVNLTLNTFLFILISLIVYIAYKDSKKKRKGHGLYAIYMLLFIFWIFNIIDILIPNFLQSTQLFIYLISSGIFLLILYKVLKKTGSG